MSNIGNSNTRNGTLASGQTVANSGYILKVASGLLTVAGGSASADADTPFAVSLDESSRDAAQALVAGGTVTYCPSGGVVWIRADAGTYNLGATVYLSDDSAGFCDATQASGATALGVYVGDNAAVVVEGTLVPVNTNASTW
jgi:hypothetical protein